MAGAAERISLARTLRDHCERQRFGKRQVLRRLPKIDEACASDAFDIAAVRRDVQIRLEDFVLAVESLELNRTADLLDFSVQRSRIDPEPEPPHLHRDR